ncbi:MAG: hypothetical protein WBO71_19015, partial [Thermoanaerobaculia bacterium]
GWGASSRGIVVDFVEEGQVHAGREAASLEVTARCGSVAGAFGAPLEGSPGRIKLITNTCVD